jgi:anti-sigma B factor antagonist
VTSTAIVDGHTVVVCRGAVDLSSVPQLHSALARAIGAAPGELVLVDLDEVDALDDAGLGVLLGAAGRARRAGGDLQLVCADPATRAQLAITGADRAVAVRASVSTQ